VAALSLFVRAVGRCRLGLPDDLGPATGGVCGHLAFFAGAVVDGEHAVFNLPPRGFVVVLMVGACVAAQVDAYLGHGHQAMRAVVGRYQVGSVQAEPRKLGPGSGTTSMSLSYASTYRRRAKDDPGEGESGSVRQTQADMPTRSHQNLFESLISGGTVTSNPCPQACRSQDFNVDSRVG
jgi:hypothetical protein